MNRTAVRAGAGGASFRDATGRRGWAGSTPPRRRVIATGGALVAPGVLAACASGSEGGVAAPPPAVRAPATIRLTTVFPDQPIVAEIQRQVERFKARAPQITVTFEPAASTGDWLQKRKVEAAAGDSVELSHHRVHAMGELGALGILSELDPYIKRDGKALKLDDYWPDTLQVGQFRGKQMGLVFRGMTVLVMVYNTQLFQSAGVTPPLDTYARGEWTWQKVREVARPLTKADDPNQSSRVFGTSTFVMGTLFNNIVPLSHFGHDLLTKDLTRIAPTSGEAVEAVEFFQSLACKDHTAPIREVDGYEQASDGHLFTGRMGVMSQGTDSLLRLRQYGWPFDVVPLPKYRRSASLINAEQISLLSGGKQKDAAWEYLKFAASAEEQTAMSKAFGTTPPYKAQFDPWVRDSDGTRDLKGARHLADVMKTAKALPIELTVKWSDLLALWDRHISSPVLWKCDAVSARDSYEAFVREGNAIMAGA